MPQTDHLALASPDIRAAFEDLFGFARIRGAVADGDKDFYANRFAADPLSVRGELLGLVRGMVASEVGIDPLTFAISALDGYPEPLGSGGDQTSYPASWLTAAEQERSQQPPSRVIIT